MTTRRHGKRATLDAVTWLVSEARVLASAEVARTHRAKGRGLLGRNGLEGALVIPQCRWVHTIGMRFALDVGFLDEHGVLVKATTMARHRIGLPVKRACTVIEAEAGAFARWGLHEGAVVELREDETDGPITPGSEARRPPSRRSP